MRLPIPANIQKEAKPSRYVVNINDVPTPPSRNIEFKDEKDKVKFIKQVETMIRKSFEYQNMIYFLKSEVDMTMCSIFNNVSVDENRTVKIEIHHSPYTLFDLCYIVLAKRLAKDEKIGHLYIANEVMQLHYKMWVGLIPLSATPHDLDHSGSLFIPISKVYGNVQKFYDFYYEHMTEEQRDTMRRRVELADKYTDIPDLLKTSYRYLEVSDMAQIEFYNEEE